MISRRRLASASVVLACAMSLVACGSSDNGRNQTAAAAVSQGFLRSGTGAYRLTSSQAACLGTGVINDFGISKATRYGFLAPNDKPRTINHLALPTTDAGTMADLYLRCADPTQTIVSTLIAGVAPKTAAAQAQLRACLDRNLTRPLLRRALIDNFSGVVDNAALTPVFTACGQLG